MLVASFVERCLDQSMKHFHLVQERGLNINQSGWPSAPNSIQFGRYVQAFMQRNFVQASKVGEFRSDVHLTPQKIIGIELQVEDIDKID